MQGPEIREISHLLRETITVYCLLCELRQILGVLITYFCSSSSSRIRLLVRLCRLLYQSTSPLRRTTEEP